MDVDVEAMAEALLYRAADRGYAVLRCNDVTPVEELRAAVRRIGALRQILVRTGLIDGILAVVLADADIWDEPVSVMRTKLATPATFNTVH